MMTEPVGLKVWYGDGTVRTQRGDRDALAAAWEAWPGTGVQYVALYYDETYTVWQQDGWTESGAPVNRRQETEHYADTYSGHDYYYCDPSSREFGAADRVKDVPEGAIVKRGSLIDAAAWRALAGRAADDRQAP